MSVGILRICRFNPTWGSPRIVAELHKLGIEVAKSTVEKCKPHGERLPSTTWRAFLDLHLKDLVAVDFVVVPTATFKILFVFVVLAQDRRRIVHFNVTAMAYIVIGFSEGCMSIRDGQDQIVNLSN